MSKHRIAWADGGLISLSRCGTTPIDLTLTAPDGPMGGNEGDAFYAKLCPECRVPLIARWGVRVEVLTPSVGTIT